MKQTGPFHAGEIAVQEAVGERHIAERVGAIVSNHLPSPAFGFLEQQPYLIAASLSAEQQVWATILWGQRGFARASDSGQQVSLNRAGIHPSPHEQLWANLEANPRIGLLAIELVQRKRIRVNGRVAKLTNEELVVDIEEAYPNCPKYIQRREMIVRPETEQSQEHQLQEGKVLNDSQIALIKTADTTFVASINASTGLDASHRGGLPGFIEVLSPTQLRIPDYPGNSMYNTLGNLQSNPHVGMVFLDFEVDANRESKRIRMLQITGQAQIQLNQNDPENRTGGTGRFWTMDVEATREWTSARSIDWSYIDASPFNPVTVPLRSS